MGIYQPVTLRLQGGIYVYQILDLIFRINLYTHVFLRMCVEWVLCVVEKSVLCGILNSNNVLHGCPA